MVPLRSHSRPRQVPPARRQRMLKRPSYNRPTGRTTPVNFLNSPTNGGSRGRTKQAASVRGRIKRSRSSDELMCQIEEAISNKLLEPSVLGAAMQTCGFKGWWQELLALLALRYDHRTQHSGLDVIQVNIALTALTACLKEQGAFGVLQSRATIAFILARQLCKELPMDASADDEQLNCYCSSSLKLATHLCSDTAHDWGQDLWEQASALAFPISGITYSTYLQFLEQYERCDEVDAFLEDPTKTKVLNYVVLCGLLERISYRKDWKRAESVWDTFMRKNIKPNLMCFLSRAKVHLLAGRPTFVLQVLQSGMDAGELSLAENGRVVQEYVQSLLIVCHSSLDAEARRLLRETLDQGVFAVKDSTSATTRMDLKRMEALAKTLLADPSEVRLRDLLVEWKAKELSVMAGWKNFRAGTGYLKDSEAVEGVFASRLEQEETRFRV